ncbi:MAG: metallophosphoesterase [Acidimicrobiales bacterium]
MNRLPPFVPSPLRVWAVDASSVQICWGEMPAGPLRVSAGDRDRAIEHPGGPGAVTLDGLAPSTTYTVDVDADGRRSTLSARTLTPPPGEILARVATVSDLHIGAGHWGFLRTMVDLSGHPEPAPTRCARGAITEASAWGADHLVIKGDAAHHRRSDHFEMLGDLLDAFLDLPMTLIPGNHDVDGMTPIEIPTTVGHRALEMTRSIAIDDLPGIRVISLDTAIPRRGIGTLVPHGDAAIEAAGEAERTADPVAPSDPAPPLSHAPPGWHRQGRGLAFR